MNKRILTKHSLVPKIPWLLFFGGSKYILNFTFLYWLKKILVNSPNKVIKKCFKLLTFCSVVQLYSCTCTLYSSMYSIISSKIMVILYCWLWSGLNPYWVLIHLNIILRPPSLNSPSSVSAYQAPYTNLS